MVEELKYRLGGVICNTHLVGFETLTNLISFKRYMTLGEKLIQKKLNSLVIKLT